MLLHRYRPQMAKLLPFPKRRVQQTAAYVLRMSVSHASRKRLSKQAPWSDRPDPPESLGNLLQKLALKRPAAVLVIESMVAEMLQQLG